MPALHVPNDPGGRMGQRVKPLSDAQTKALTPMMRLAVANEPECVIGKDLAAITDAADLAERQYLQKRGAILDQLPLDVRLGNVCSAARRAYVDLGREERLVRHMLAQGREEAARRRLTTIEIRLRQRDGSLEEAA
jgi:hypothetical protein